MCLLKAKRSEIFLTSSDKTEGYRMVFGSICEHASSVFIFASTSSCQIFLTSSELFRKIQKASSEHFEYLVNFPLAVSSLLL